MSLKDHSSSPGFVSVVLRAILRALQFIFAIAVCGLYGTDLNNAAKHHLGGDPKWIYAVVIGAMSAVTALVYGIPFVKSYIAFAWDSILFILWIAVFGIFGKMYIHENAEGDGGVLRMKNAVWVDLVNVFLWLISAIWGAIIFFRGRRTRFTGRATV